MHVFFLQSNNSGKVELVYRLLWRWLFLHQLPVRAHDHFISQVSSVCGIHNQRGRGHGWSKAASVRPQTHLAEICAPPSSSLKLKNRKLFIDSRSNLSQTAPPDLRVSASYLATGIRVVPTMPSIWVMARKWITLLPNKIKKIEGKYLKARSHTHENTKAWALRLWWRFFFPPKSANIFVFILLDWLTKNSIFFGCWGKQGT